ncbi:hypothetical protein DYB36_002294 [Aphanomyces astaci]|uniref:START domain-containing protein n=1 Tax=Aphanomyces astaci TaxID=112090 RepID=A0A397AEQ7_APHAT|nr:hypothetical protein DYB36_002294 [Aphanomyces astaci]
MAIVDGVPRPLMDTELRRSLSSASSSSNDKDAILPSSTPSTGPSSTRRGKKLGGKAYTPDRCKLCLRHFSRLLQCKQCCNCKNIVCALCALKIPMFHSEKSKLGKHALHARLCANCYDTNILNQANSDSSETDGDINTHDHDADDGTFILVDEADSDDDVPSRQSHTGLWLSLFTATLLFGTIMLEDLDLLHRAGIMAILYVAFVFIHPAWSGGTCRGSSLAKPSRRISTRRKCSTSSNTSDDLSADAPCAAAVVPLTVDDYRQRKAELAARFDELKASTAWVKNESKSKGAISLFEIDCGDAQPIFKVVCHEAFVPDATADQMLAFLSSADPAVRKKWDTGMAANEVVDEIVVDDVTVSVVHNTQKPHGFGLVSSRDFVVLAFQHSEHAYVQGGVARPDIAVKGGVLRGTVNFISFECEPAEDGGFHMTYINHVDIGGSVPKSLVANGTADNMVKMMQMCIASKKKWFS